MDPVVVHFEHEKATPGTNKYKEVTPEDGSRPVVGALYVTKAAMPQAPRKLTLTITSGD